MVFCKSYPIYNIIKSKLNKDTFKDLQFKRDPIKSEYRAIILEKDKITEVKQFIKTYFGNPPSTPVLDIPEDKLCGENDIILYVRDGTNIIGCVRSRYIGMFLDKRIYCNDCFCVHPLWRKKGLGDYLLIELQIYANKNNIPYSLVLKEGPKINVLADPFYSSIYVYREIHNTNHTIKSVSIDNAYKLIDIFSECNKLVIIKNRDNDNQYWKLYEKGIHKILACVQDTYQSIHGDKIGWITGWIESPTITDDCREEASIQISDSMYGMFRYIWTNKKWTTSRTNWKIDGPFHWYLCQWTTSIPINRSYCILN